jgi:putative membrane protein insertion efficiency factor
MCEMKQIPKHIILLILRGYKFAVSPWVGSACRYSPTCSDYAGEAIELRGILRGSLMAARRIFRCHPFGGSGFDPVQEEKPRPTRVGAAIHRLRITE